MKKAQEALPYLEDNQKRLLETLPTRFRPLFADRELTKKRSSLIIGPRGVGKTTFLLWNSTRKERVLYVSADNPRVAGISLWDLAETAFLAGFEGLIIDEVHFAPQWSQHLKAIYDSYPKKSLWASDSSSVVLRKGVADISRRFPRVSLPLMSLREYLFLETGKSFSVIDPLSTNSAQASRVLSELNVLSHFRQYLKHGFRPIYLEGDYENRLISVIEKTIFSDVPFFVPQVHENHLRLMNAIIGYLAAAPIPTLNIDSLSREWSVGKDKLYALLTVMEEVGLLNIVRYQNDHKVSGKGAKIFLADPSMYTALGGGKGNIREATVVTCLRGAGKRVFACRNETQGDLIVNGKIVEIGGRNKKNKGADFVIRDDIESPNRNIIPLWVIAMGY